MMNKRFAWRFVALLAFFGSGFQQSAAAAEDIVFAINEGATYRVMAQETRDKFKDIATDLGKILHKTVRLEPVPEYPKLKEGLAAKRYDIVLVHPAHIAIRAMKDSGYRLVAVSKAHTEYRASFLVMETSKLKDAKDLKGKTVGAPDQDSISAWMIRATLRDALGDANGVQYKYTRYQDAIPFMVEQGLTDTAASGSGEIVKQWKQAGHGVLFTSKSVPIKELLVSSRLNNDELQAIQGYFTSLVGNETGKNRLQTIGLPQGFIGFDSEVLLALGKWLGV